MITGSVVGVYGLKPGHDRPSRLGPGALVHPKLVLLKDLLGDALAAADPPTVLRVGVAFNTPTPTVEVIEVLQTMQSLPTESGPLWAVELVESSKGPLRPIDVDPPLLRAGNAVRQPQPQALAAKRFWCALFPNSTFCH